jgi:hypothetical protein
MTDIDKEMRAYFNSGKRKKRIALLLRVLDSVITILAIAPIKFFLWYSILKAINADRLLWFCFYAYIPIFLFSTILTAIIQKLAKEVEE